METDGTDRDNRAISESSQRQRLEHLGKLGLRVKAILGQFWESAATPDQVQTDELQGWIVALADCTVAEVGQAWDVYLKAGPRSAKGALYRPDAGFLWRLVMTSRRINWPTSDHQAFVAAAMVEPDRELDEARAKLRAITAAAGRRQ